MKKILKVLGIVIGLPAIYFVINIITSSIYSVIYALSNGINLKSADAISMLSIITSNQYSIILFTDLVMLIILFLIFLPMKDGLVKRCVFKKIPFKNNIYIIILGIGVVILNSILIGVLTNIFPSYKEVSNLLAESQNSVYKLLIVVILAPIFEEIFYRGVIFGFLRKNFNLVIAIIVQALVFSIMHGNIVQGIYTFIMGSIAALIYIHYESLYGSILFHIIYNLFGVVVLPAICARFTGITINIAIIILGMSCIIFSTIKLLDKYSNILYKEK